MLVIPANAKAQLEVLGKFPVVADIEALNVRVGLANELEVTNASGVPEDERITKRFRRADGGRRAIDRQAQSGQGRARNGHRTIYARLIRAGDGAATNGTYQPVVGDTHAVDFV